MAFKFRDVDHYQAVWRNNGRDPISGEKVRLEDAIATPDSGPWLPKVVSSVVREAIEPLLVGTSLLQRIQYVPGMQIAFPTMSGALHAADIAEGMAYPERKMQLGGSEAIATIGKSGIAVAITEEMMRYSQFDVVSMHLRAAGAALARLKEQKCFKMINGSGVVAFDNLNPTQSMLGVTHGRDLQGAGNGSITLDDIFDMWSMVLQQGFYADTLLVHPLTWVMFVKDPMTRAFALSSGGQGPWFNRWNGNVNVQTGWGTFGGLGRTNGQPTNIVPGGNAGSQTATGILDYPQNQTSAPIIPNALGIPLRIVVSPMVPFDPANKLTNVFMFDSSSLGAYIVDEEPTMDEWQDLSTDMRKIKIRERYALAVLNEGQAIAIAKNVKIVQNELNGPVQATYQVSGSWSPLDPTTSVL